MKALFIPIPRHFTAENHPYKHMRFSVVQWLDNQTGPECMSNRRMLELKYIWDVPTIAPLGINQYV